jgi:hypothetical protein
MTVQAYRLYSRGSFPSARHSQKVWPQPEGVITMPLSLGQRTRHAKPISRTSPALASNAFAGCVGGQLTTTELQKCLALGIGGAGCFGNNNAIVKAIGDAWKGVAGGPNSVFNNPGQLAGGPNSVINNPGQILGGPNSAARNPGQLVPPPLNLGTVGGKRVCIPWC